MSAVIASLDAEWDRLIATPAFISAANDLASTSEHLAAEPWRTRLTANSTHVSDHSADAAAAFTDLLNAHRRGHPYAGRILLQWMLPALKALTARTMARTDAEEQAQRGSVALWEAICKPTHTPRPHIDLRMAMVTAMCPPRRPEQPTPPESLAPPPTPEPADTELEDVATLIRWGMNNAVLTETDAHLLARTYTTPATPGRALAAELGLTHTALRARTSRAVKALTAAVAADLQGQPIPTRTQTRRTACLTAA